MQDAWMTRKAEDIQGLAERNEMKNFFKAIKAIYGPCIKGNAPLLSSDGTTLLTEKSQILKCWAEHFRSSALTANTADREIANNEALGRALQKYPSLLISHLRCCHLLAPSSGHEQ
ncbi:unnamed protein product [Schistocephalus solidus]|uniref:Uncharacterized protein n=1 Tax=Schistocephalus solidus TaxID=70667 RepID=A0A183SV32_SCHSO|nr:unnamed protein product [Schistocephalus solidus]